MSNTLAENLQIIKTAKDQIKAGLSSLGFAGEDLKLSSFGRQIGQVAEREFQVKRELSSIGYEIENLSGMPSAVHELKQDYQGLSSQYGSLSSQYEGLSTQYGSLSSQYEGLSTQYGELR